MSMKTSSEWYQEDKDCDIRDPDGWPRDESGFEFWYFVLITKEDYQKRKSLSTPARYTEEHPEPY